MRHFFFLAWDNRFYVAFSEVIKTDKKIHHDIGPFIGIDLKSPVDWDSQKPEQIYFNSFWFISILDSERNFQFHVFRQLIGQLINRLIEHLRN